MATISVVAELAEARGEDARGVQREIAYPKEQLASRAKALFGDASDRRSQRRQEAAQGERGAAGARPPL